MKYCTINTDASVDPKTGCSGYAFWVVSSSFKFRGYGKFKSPIFDSNEAEMKAVINAMHLLCERDISCIEAVVVNVDNSTARHVINGKVKSFKSKTLDDTRSVLQEHCSKFPKCYAKDIKGHTYKKSPRHYVNRWCDEYSRKGRESSE